MMCAPGKPMLELVDEEELKQRATSAPRDPPPDLDSANVTQQIASSWDTM
jgi:hypothetical protein